jgi:hypothetical protein
MIFKTLISNLKYELRNYLYNYNFILQKIDNHQFNLNRFFTKILFNKNSIKIMSL